VTLTYLEALATVAKLPMKFHPPGAQYDYSNSNYFLLCELVDTLVGPSSDYMDYIRSEVLDVFGMPRTGLIDRVRAHNPAMPHLQGHPHEGWRDPICGYSAGGFASTMDDLEAFAIGIANGLVLQEKTYRAMWTNYPLNGGGQGAFGYGWAVTTGVDARMRVQKNGGGYGWSSAVVYTPADDSGPISSPSASVCVMMNGTGNADALVDDLLTKVVACGMS
jgi:D-alanyl-D-alanine carboxypeptidase